MFWLSPPVAAAGGPGNAVPDTPQTLDPVVITATRTPHAASRLPYSTATVSSQQIGQRLYRSTPDALREVPGVSVQKTSHGQGSPFIRGFTGFHNLFLIDGVRLNNSVFRDGPNQYWNTVDPLSLDRLEVVKGPGSVLYGSDAIGGVVNAVTRSPYTYTDGLGHGGKGYYRVSSAENSHTGRGELSLTTGRALGFLLGGSGKQFGDLIAGRETGRQPNTGYDEWDVDFKARYFLNPDTELVALHQRVQQNNVPRTHRTHAARSFAGTTIGTDRKHDLDQDRDLTYLQLHAQNIDSFFHTIRASVSYHVQSETRDRVRASNARDLEGVDVGAIGFWTQLESTTPIGELVYGLEYYRDDVSSFSSTNAIQGPVADDASYDLLGLFIQDTIALSDRSDLILGGRFSYTRAEADSVRDAGTGNRFSLADDWNDVVGSVRLVYRLDEAEHWGLYGGVSQGFRAPNLSDLTRFDTARSNEIETPAPGLDPELYIAYEAGLRTRYENFNAEVAYFHTDIDQMIVRTPTGNVIAGDAEVTKRNSGDGFIHGIELGGSVRLHPQWTTFGSVTWVEGEVNTFPTSAPVLSREPIDKLMPLLGQVGLRWDHPSQRAWAEGVVTLAATQDKLSTRDAADTQRIPPAGTPGYATLSLRGGWRVNDQASLSVGIENVTDEYYRVHGSGQNEPGMNFVLGVDIVY